MKIRESLLKRHERALEQLNATVLLLRDTMALSKADCDSLLEVINEKLPGEMNQIAHRLRWALIKARDVIEIEDGITILDNYQPHPCKDDQGTGEIYHCKSPDCPVHGERNKNQPEFQK